MRVYYVKEEKNNKSERKREREKVVCATVQREDKKMLIRNEIMPSLLCVCCECNGQFGYFGILIFQRKKKHSKNQINIEFCKSVQMM